MDCQSIILTFLITTYMLGNHSTQRKNETHNDNNDLTTYNIIKQTSISKTGAWVGVLGCIIYHLDGAIWWQISLVLISDRTLGPLVIIAAIEKVLL